MLRCQLCQRPALAQLGYRSNVMLPEILQTHEIQDQTLLPLDR